MLGVGLEPTRDCSQGILSRFRYTVERKPAHTETTPLITCKNVDYAELLPFALDFSTLVRKICVKIKDPDLAC